MSNFKGVCFTSEQTKEERDALFDAIFNWDEKTPEQEGLIKDNTVDVPLESEMIIPIDIARRLSETKSKPRDRSMLKSSSFLKRK